MAETDNIEVLRAGCFFCHVRCGVLVTKKNGRIVDIKGDPDCPHNKGFVCSRLDKKRYLDGFVYNPNRLKRPLKRAGERGGGKWEEITWDQAFDEIAAKLSELRDEYGAETLAFTEGTARTWSWLHYKFTNLFGSPTRAATAPFATAPTCGLSLAPMVASAPTNQTGSGPISWFCGAATPSHPNPCCGIGLKPT